MNKPMCEAGQAGAGALEMLTWVFGRGCTGWLQVVVDETARRWRGGVLHGCCLT